MKHFVPIIFLLPVMALFIACEGPIGPEGPQGIAGVDGIDGKDGNAVCLNCHNTAVKGAVVTAYETSGHAAATTLGYAGGRASCARCHSGTGFIEFQETGSVFQDLVNPKPIDCDACHDFHISLDFENEPNFALRTTAAVNLIMDDTKTIDFEGSSNLCANCHQPRRSAPVDDDGDGQFAVTSSHYGPHHGPQSTILEGFGAYEFAGVSYPTDPTAHRTMASCTTCHMHGDPAQHSFNPKIDACTECHSGATDFDINGKRTEITALMATLEGKLQTYGLIYHDEHGEWHVNTGTYSVDQVGAFYNFATIFDDRSMGVHNYPYTKAVLDASIAALP